MKQYLTPEEASEYTGFKPRTLQTWRQTGDGPKYYARNRRIRYKISDIDAWLEEAPNTSTKEVCRA